MKENFGVLVLDSYGIKIANFCRQVIINID